MMEDPERRRVIDKARELLPLVQIGEQIRWFIALVCIDAGASGHRADIVVSHAARTLCAWREAERALPPATESVDLGDHNAGAATGAADASSRASTSIDAASCASRATTPYA